MGQCIEKVKNTKDQSTRRPTVIQEGIFPDDRRNQRRKSSLLSTFSTESKHVFEPPVRIGSFNIKHFGKEKIKDPEVLNLLVRLVSRYDILFVQEIVDASGLAIRELLDKVNDHTKTQHDHVYDFIVSPRLGRSKTKKEQYAFIYNMARFKLKKHAVFVEGEEDVFSREPFVVQFTSHCLQEADNIILIGIHTQPGNAAKEIDALDDVRAWVKSKFRPSTNLFILGDLNAGGTYVKQSDWANIRTRTNRKYHWLIADYVDTTATHTLAAYDRIIAYNKSVNLVVADSAKPFRYDIELDNVSERLMLKISDHYPVEMMLSPKVHSVIRQFIKVRKATIIHDMRYHEEDVESTIRNFNLPRFALTKRFNAPGHLSGFEVIGSFECAESAVEGCKSLRLYMPNIVSYSMLASVIFSLRTMASQTRMEDIEIKLSTDASERTCFFCISWMDD